MNISLFTQTSMQKGSVTLLELLMVTSMATVAVGGITLSAQEILVEAVDTQRVANIRQLTTALEFYYSDNDSYPQTTEFDVMITALAKQGYIGSLPVDPKAYTYSPTKKGQGYVLRTRIENAESLYLDIDLNEVEAAIDCEDPYYCVRG